MKFNHTNKKPARSTPQGGAPVQAKANGQAKAPEQATAPVIAHTPVLERVAFTDLGLSEPVLRALRAGRAFVTNGPFLEATVDGHGPMNKERLATRVKAHEQGAWVREAALAHARKQQQRQQKEAA